MELLVSSFMKINDWPMVYSAAVGVGAAGMLVVRVCNEKQRQQREEDVTEAEVDIEILRVSELYRRWCAGERSVEGTLRKKAEEELKEALALEDKIKVLQLLTQAEHVNMLQGYRRDPVVTAKVSRWKRERYKSLFELFVYSKPHVEVILLVTILNGVRPTLWEVSKEAGEGLEDAAKNVNVNAFAGQAIKYCVYAALDSVISFVIATLNRYEVETFTREVKTKILRHVLCLDLAYFDTHQADLTQFSDDIDKLRYLVTDRLFQLLRFCAVSFQAVRCAARCRGQLLVSTACLSCLPVLAILRSLFKIVELRIDKSTGQAVSRRGKTEAATNYSVPRVLDRVQLIRCAVAEDREIEAVLREEAAGFTDHMASSTIGERALESIRGTVVPNLLVMFLSATGLEAVRRGLLQEDEVPHAVVTAIEAFDNLLSLYEEVSDLTDSDYTLRLITLLNARPTIDTGRGEVLDTFEGSLQLERVCFKYAKGCTLWTENHRADMVAGTPPPISEDHHALVAEPAGGFVLKDLSFRIKPRSRTAVIGASGGGKSTLASLLVRLYDTSSGTIRVSGVDIKNFNVRWLRKKVVAVQQAEQLPPGNILKAFTYGVDKERATLEAVHAVSDLVCMHDSISRLKEGYATPLGVGGVMLSGGQVQRISLARSILLEPTILILDEATTGLDGYTESLVLSRLLTSLPNTTIIMIAHRLATARYCDDIICLKDGSVAERGSYEDLVKRGGETARLLRIQEEEPVVDRGPAISPASVV